MFVGFETVTFFAQTNLQLLGSSGLLASTFQVAKTSGETTPLPAENLLKIYFAVKM